MVANQVGGMFHAFWAPPACHLNRLRQLCLPTPPSWLLQMGSALVPTHISRCLSLEYQPQEYDLCLIGLWLLFCFIYLNWYKHRFLGIDILLCCKETGLWWILFQYSVSIFDRKAKRYRECLKQGKFFRWENPKIGGRKQFVPFSDSWTWGCERMAGCSLHLNLLFPAYIATQCSHSLVDHSHSHMTKLGQGNFNRSHGLTSKPRAEWSLMNRTLCSLLFHCLQINDGSVRSHVMKVGKELGLCFIIWKKMVHHSGTHVPDFTQEKKRNLFFTC